MKALLVTNYWLPYNNAQTIRWYQYAKYMEFDVLTVKKTKGIEDETLEKRNNSVKYINSHTTVAVFNGVILSVSALFHKADLYIFTIPTETLLIGAYILQKMGKNVIIDTQDSIDRKHIGFKLFVPLYKWLYKRIKHRIVCMKFIDPSSVCIYHGHDDIELREFVTKPELLKHTGNRLTHYLWNRLLVNGCVPDYTAELNKIQKNYGQSSFVNIRWLWRDKLNLIKNRFGTEMLNDEMWTMPLYSWKVSAQLIKNQLYIRFGYVGNKRKNKK